MADRHRYSRASRPAPDEVNGHAVDGDAQERDALRRTEFTAEHAAPLPVRDAKGRWLRGTPSPNPGGRRPGSRNRMNALSDELFGERAAELIAVVIQRAMDGNDEMLKLALSRISPPVRGRLMHLPDLPPLDSVSGCDEALGMVIAAAASGQLTTEEAQVLASLVKSKQDSVTARDVAERLAALEGRVISVPVVEYGDADHS
ncbi:MAG TPA: hypothetical protein VFG47_19915 [Geminicoccaceae bacterium]|nr:hypothetical protein [Geminicoccaceae bacterium]